jgi:hypothetical protein
MIPSESSGLAFRLFIRIDRGIPGRKKIQRKSRTWLRSFDTCTPGYQDMGLEVLRSAMMSLLVFWVTAPWGIVSRYRSFAETYYLYLPGVTYQKSNIDVVIEVPTSFNDDHVDVARLCL